MTSKIKVVTYTTGDGRTALTTATQTQVDALREVGRLQAVRRVRQFRHTSVYPPRTGRN
jgi:hypothetical protein